MFPNSNTPNVSTADRLAQIGEFVKERRIKSNLTQAEAAKRANISRRSLSTLEAGGGTSLENFLRVLYSVNAGDFVSHLEPSGMISPMAQLRGRTTRLRVRHPSGKRGTHVG